MHLTRIPNDKIPPPNENKWLLPDIFTAHGLLYLAVHVHSSCSTIWQPKK